MIATIVDSGYGDAAGRGAGAVDVQEDARAAVADGRRPVEVDDDGVLVGHGVASISCSEPLTPDWWSARSRPGRPLRIWL